MYLDLLECLKDYLEGKNTVGPALIADWIEEVKFDHPEAKVYIKRLRMKKVYTRTLLDVCVKFGTSRVRKEASKIGRLLLLRRKTSLRLLKTSCALNDAMLKTIIRVENIFEKRLK